MKEENQEIHLSKYTKKLLEDISEITEFVRLKYKKTKSSILEEIYQKLKEITKENE